MLSQSEADSLIAMTKYFVDSGPVILAPGAKAALELMGTSTHDQFSLDLWRSGIKLTKVRDQLRTRSAIILVRLEIDAAPHTNPDGKQLGGTHIHLYKEGYEAKWAYPVDKRIFTNLTDIGQVFQDFCQYCHIVSPPALQSSLI